MHRSETPLNSTAGPSYFKMVCSTAHGLLLVEIDCCCKGLATADCSEYESNNEIDGATSEVALLGTNNNDCFESTRRMLLSILYSAVVAAAATGPCCCRGNCRCCNVHSSCDRIRVLMTSGGVAAKEDTTPEIAPATNGGTPCCNKYVYNGKQMAVKTTSRKIQASAPRNNPGMPPTWSHTSVIVLFEVCNPTFITSRGEEATTWHAPANPPLRICAHSGKAPPNDCLDMVASTSLTPSLMPFSGAMPKTCTPTPL
mmetsp:Transcript_3955/g.7018  ORF Transcript_3955/g.7018 Transcript_3955/m.7018 type:complete len:256 (-) Transcript_3955:424-1191(-)